VVAFIEFSHFFDPLLVWIGFGVATFLLLPYNLTIERRRTFEAQARAELELRAAHDMQMGLMPKEDPIVKGFEISGACIPASEVGGDFYDYVWLDSKKTKLGIALADVSGKAMKAAMTAVMTSGMLYSEAQRNQSPRQILARINQPLYLRSDKRVFTALSFAVIDTKTKRLTYSSAGQSHPVLLRNGTLTYIKTQGVRLPLGVKEELDYRDVKVKLRSGDSIVFYTDGVPEAMKADGSLYGFERFEQLLKRNSIVASKQLRDAIVGDVKTFTGNVEQHDDMTVVVVKVK
ncbi:MAG: PP2C family protein-serine/threonine phosphatase, partial [Ignavibacteriales bacterium]|nr:PP2C family protein-serine/threonine phosphatase [Ignavibacteriales bacterium]